MSDTKSLQERVAPWLKEHGYPLEMQVSKTFQDAGFNVKQSQYYDDPETGKTREIDVIASNTTIDKQDNILIVACCIECKLSNNSPWVIFASKLKIQEYTPPYVFVAKI